MVTITVPLEELIQVLLGDFYGSTHGVPSITIPKQMGLVLNAYLKSSEAYKVVWDNGIPTLWHLRAYMDDQDRIRKMKEYAEKERIKRWIHKANHEMITEAMLKQTPALPYSHASMMAMRMLNDIDRTWPVVHEYWGVRKLITSVEEL